MTARPYRQPYAFSIKDLCVTAHRSEHYCNTSSGPRLQEPEDIYMLPPAMVFLWYSPVEDVREPSKGFIARTLAAYKQGRLLSFNATDCLNLAYRAQPVWWDNWKKKRLYVREELNRIILFNPSQVVGDTA